MWHLEPLYQELQCPLHMHYMEATADSGAEQAYIVHYDIWSVSVSQSMTRYMQISYIFIDHKSVYKTNRGF